jgi:hypothetical protein
VGSVMCIRDSAYRAAIARVGGDAERRFLERRLQEMERSVAPA